MNFNLLDNKVIRSFLNIYYAQVAGESINKFKILFLDLLELMKNKESVELLQELHDLINNILPKFSFFERDFNDYCSYEYYKVTKQLKFS
jgi:hypothetical protein